MDVSGEWWIGGSETSRVHRWFVKAVRGHERWNVLVPRRAKFKYCKPGSVD